MVDFATIFDRTPVMAILRGYTADRSVELARTAWDLGIACVEVPVQSPEAVESLAAVVEAAAGRDVVIGAGTVTTSERVARSLAAGAQFTVAPGFDAAVAAESEAAGLPHLPGVATPSEVGAAMAHGYTWLKAFPASLLTPAWLAAIAGPFPQARLVCTGGIDSHNARAFLDAGARGVAVGSALESPEQLPALATLVGRGAGR
ncbi:bifunctional 4-hydroxy-2-oxoglutarate aldolase/2-dehydro-3-deoxy-phosphogluconate aldolase [Lapillicoccus jejuensis]|uniref:2-keto-3-deoxy-phosphogluconate aldolase n=1 Tax=Lapillicoccus jejuensis TaxID=402171 RepID=A0A542E1J9_9MICO|nr:bifunctional 4-hydroxy-2-oxoglutarate aldolase/2-dehydro-3-deoxy-phosphogluconate aldolase [Lapillicoccus jejuensis]TQJ09218.1 2-keto-3-deoxy-phosphogluconate aldolase [Lapillicoccus jejuensis]